MKRLLKKAALAALLLTAFIPASMDAAVYITATFNSWAESDAAWELKETAEGSNIYTGKFNIPASSFILFEFVDGSGDHYGVKSSEGYFVAFPFTDNGLAVADLEKNGKRFQLQNWDTDKEVEFYLDMTDLNLGAKISATAPTKMYMCGAPTGWSCNETAVLNRVGSTSVYEGQIDVPSGFNRFRFYTMLWSTSMDAGYNALGTLSEVTNVTSLDVNATEAVTPVYPGTGMWDLPDWRGGKLNFKLDFAKMTLNVSDPTTGLEVAVSAAKTDVYGVDGGVHVSAADETAVAVYAPMGALVDYRTVPAGETTIALPAGIYIVNGQKVAVK